ncbi:hypothetical protein BIU87_08165 [Streptomyces sp. ZS0098]|nr:hypothetical protein BIU87_08165 [Streptomyces sp. ZS0098]
MAHLHHEDPNGRPFLVVQWPGRGIGLLSRGVDGSVRGVGEGLVVLRAAFGLGAGFVFMSHRRLPVS